MTETNDTTDPRTDTAATVAGAEPSDTTTDEPLPTEPRDPDGTDTSRRVTLRSTLNILGIVLLIVLVAPFVVYAVPGVVGADASYVVLSGSMEPAISGGDVVIVESVPPAMIAADDVITYSRSDESATVTHRVIDIDGTGSERVFYTKGDANQDADQRPVPASALVGVVGLTIPYIGYVIQFVGTTTGFGLLVILPFGALLVTEVASFLRRRRREQADVEPVPTERSPPPADVALTAPHAPRTNGEVPQEPVGPPSGRQDVSRKQETSLEGVRISVTDLQLTLGVLAVALPYAAYVAVEQQSALSIGVAVGAGTAFALLTGVLLSVWLRERSRASPVHVSTASDHQAASDGGTSRGEER